MPVSGRTICEQIEAVQKILQPLIPSILKVARDTDEATVLVLQALGYTEADIALFRTNVTKSSVVTCASGSDVNQLNVFDNSICAELLGCANRVDVAYQQEQLDRLGFARAQDQYNRLTELCTFRAVQSNDASTYQTCLASQSASSFAQQPFNVAVKAAVAALLNSAPIDCTLIPDTCTDEQYITSINTCTNSIGVDQSNLALCASSVQQSNVANLINSCVLSTVINQQATQAVEATVKSEIIHTQPKSESTWFNYVILGGIGVLVLLLLKRKFS